MFAGNLLPYPNWKLFCIFYKANMDMYNSISSRLEGVGDLGLGSIVLLYDPRPWARCHIGGETVKPTRVVRALSLVVSPLHRDRDGVLVPDGEVFTNKLTRIKQIL